MDKPTPLIDKHKALNARIVPFGGFLMPLQYTGIVKEHEAVRTAAGLFDISHMGEFAISGEASLTTLNNCLSGDFTKMRPGQIKYTLLLNDAGGIADDLLVFCHEPGKRYLLVVNASNIAKDFARLQSLAPRSFIDQSPETAAIALQGPKAPELLAGLIDGGSLPVKYYTFNPAALHNGAPVLVSRNGYTGEDGFELYGAAEIIGKLWDALIELGAAPCGLGARDTLRFECSMPLYGHELTDGTTPAEAGLAKFSKAPADPPARKRVGLSVEGKAIPRQGCAILAGGEKVGEVTSGMFCPTLGGSRAMGYIPAGCNGGLAIDIRGAQIPAVIVDMPFYKR